MKRFWHHACMVLLAVLSTVALFTVMILLMRLHLMGVALVLYVAIPLVILIWSIVRFLRRRNALTLTYSVSLFVIAIVAVVTFFALVISALNA